MISVGKQFDVVVVGGGPAGLAAAVCASEQGARVALVDDNPKLGGQIWRTGLVDAGKELADWSRRLISSGVEILCGARVFDSPRTDIVHAETDNGIIEIRYRKLILTTGARERFLPFPGWTFPNVMGAGALQAFVKSGFPISGKRVVVAGTGPLLLAVAAYLRGKGAEIAMICEQASRASLAKFSLSLLGHRNKIPQALSLRKELAGVPFRTSSWLIAAAGNGVLKTVLISTGASFQKIDCDFLACGFHLVPNTELPALLGCRLQDGFVQVDRLQQTSLAGVYCAGEPTGIGGVELSVVEGQIAGLAAVGREDAAGELFGKRVKLCKFADALQRTFALRPELKRISLPETIVCRCEDVTYARLKQHNSWRAAKLQTRCGMGPCQGRVCGPATEFLFGWAQDSVRPPVFPTRIESLVVSASEAEQPIVH
jgi:NADPH-dependent 2,4-dienoyl-CoA reductase/sulfur reductase-like enzyme